MHRRNAIKYLLLAVATIAAVACSHKKNTWLSRNYQTLVSHYNVYFNACQAFDGGILTIRQTYQNDYSHVLPVYEFSDAQTAKAANSDMETVLIKCHKLIQLHSITAKPKRKDQASERYKHFYAQEEFNPYIDRAYLLIGKANVVRHENDEAIEYFDFLSRKFEGKTSTYEGKIWKSIAYCQLEQYGNARSALESYDIDGLAPIELYPQYMAAYANIHICQEEYAEAIPYMEVAVDEADTRHERRRYKYILAQLYRANGQNEKAAPLFLELSRGAADYDMAFAAKLDLATVATTEEELLAAEKKLNKMLRDAKNHDQLDQVYYALGKLEEVKGNDDNAIDDYNKSIEASVSNDNQKGLSYRALADLSLEIPDYLEAGTALDSAAFYLDDSNARKSETVEQSEKIAPLAAELRLIEFLDSLLMVGNMTEKERNKLIDGILDELEKERRAAEEARIAEEEAAMSQSQFNQINQGTSQSAQWYFYNTTMVAAGKSTFAKKWGRRPNEDDWRRSNKSSVANDEESGNDELDDEEKPTDDKSTTIPEQKIDGEVTRETLMANVPLTDQAKSDYEQRICEAMFRSGAILYDDLQDYTSAISQLEILLQRCPDCSCRYDALVILYFAQTKNNDSGASATAAQIRREFPQSSFAQYLTQPDYFDQKSAELAEREARYERVYNAYLGGSYSEAVAQATSQLSDTTNAEYAPKYLLIRSLSYAKQAQTTAFRADLETITERYAGGEEDSLARKFIAMLDSGLVPVKATVYDSPLEQAGKFDNSAAQKTETFVFNADTTQTLVCIVDRGKQNQAQFSLADYNFSNYLLDDFDLKITQLADGRAVVLVGGFENMQAAMTYLYAIRVQAFWSEVTEATIPELYIVSDNNLRLALLTSISDDYKAFFEANYLKK